jgi:hypothetical protein
MIRLAALAIALAGLASPAFSTEWVYCTDAGGLASFGYLAGDGLGVLSIVALNVSAGEKVWASDVAYGPGDPVSVGQGFEDEHMVKIDAMDEDFAKLAELRLFKTSEGDDYVSAGTLRIVGMGAWAVACEGP